MVLVCHVTSPDHVLKGFCELMASYSKSPPCHVWWPLAWLKWRYNVFNLLRDVTRPCN